MRYVAFLFPDGKEDHGEWDGTEYLSIPDASTICLEIGDGKWLQINISEWGHVQLKDKPEPRWKD